MALIAALAGYPVLQLQAITLLFAGYLVLEEHFDPFLSDRRRAAERTSYAAALFTCNAMLAAYSVGDDLVTIVFSSLVIATQIGAVLVFAFVLYLDYTEGRSSRSSNSRNNQAFEMTLTTPMPQPTKDTESTQAAASSLHPAAAAASPLAGAVPTPSVQDFIENFAN